MKLADIKTNEDRQNTGDPLAYLGEKLGGGFTRFFEGAVDFATGVPSYAIGALTGNQNLTEFAKNTFQNDWFDYEAADRRFNPSQGWKIAGDVAAGIGNSLPTMGITFGIGSLANAAGLAVSQKALQGISYAVLGASAAGGGVSEAVKKTGNLGWSEIAYGALSGAVEAGTEAFGGEVLNAGTGAITKNIAAHFAKDASKSIANTSIGQIGKQLLKDFAEEGFEELISAVTEPAIGRLTGVDPNAEWNVTDILYQGLVGGLSGLLMGAGNQAAQTTSHFVQGNRAIGEGKVDTILEISKRLTDPSAAESIDEDTYKGIVSAYNELTQSMQKTDGQVKTVRQKTLLGYLRNANMIAIASPAIYREMMNILNNAENVARSASAFLVDENGNKVTITAEQLREGIDLNEKSPANLRKQLSNAMKNNRALTGLAVASFTGKLVMQTNDYVRFMQENPGAVTDDTLSQFIETADDATKASLGEVLGIKDWNAATASVVNEALKTNADKLIEMQKRSDNLRTAAKGESKTAPAKFGKSVADGTYEIEDGFRAVKQGDEYRLYDSKNDRLSKAMSASEMNEAVKGYREGKAVAAENNARAEAEAFATEHVDGYGRLSETAKRAIRMTIRQGLANNVSTEEIALCANLSAKTGLTVVFDENMLKFDGKGKTANGEFDMANTIYINPSANRTETIRQTLTHEVAHWLFNAGVNTKAMVDLSIQGMRKEMHDKMVRVVEKYADFYRAKGMDPTSPQVQAIILDEISARYAEEIMGNDTFLEQIMGADPTVKTRLPSFVRKWMDKMKSFEGVSAIGNKFIKTYADAFRRLSEYNAGSQAYSASMKERRKLLGATGRYNLAFVEKHREMLKESYNPKESKQSLEDIMKVYNRIVKAWNEIGIHLDSKFLNEWNQKKTRFGNYTIFKEQSGYKYTAELSSMCKKGVPLFMAIDTVVRKELMKQLKTDVMGKEEKEVMYRILQNHGYEIPCAICYVEQARQREGTIIKNFLDGSESKIGWNSTLDLIEKKMHAAGVDYKFESFGRDITTDAYNPKTVVMTAEQENAYLQALMEITNDEIRKNNGDSSKKTKKELVKAPTYAGFQEALKGSVSGNLALLKALALEPNSRRRIGNDMLYSSLTTGNLSGIHPKLYSVFNRQGGTGGYKTKQSPVIYLGDILGKKYATSKVRNEGGIRNQSNSDLQAYLILDMMQIYADLAAKGYYMHAYTKVLGELKLFGLTGAKINASLIPKVQLIRNADGTINIEATRENAGLDENGNLIFDTVEGIDPNETFMLCADPEYSKNVGAICIAYSDKHMAKLLDDPRIQLIIGFHDKTNDPTKRYVGARYADNYNGRNEAKDANGKTQHVTFGEYLAKAEKMFGYNASSETARVQTSEYKGKTYVFDDIPRLAAQMYKDDLASKGWTPAYADFANHENYYKLLGDFTLYDSQGHYAPHKKVRFVIPEMVPVQYEKLGDNSKNGTIRQVDSQKYIENMLSRELETIDHISEDLAEEGPGSLMAELVEGMNDLQKAKPTETVYADERMSLPDSDYMKAIEDADNAKAREILDEQAKKSGYTMLATHRTDADFTVFDKGSRSGRNGKTLGDAFYVAEYKKEWRDTPIHTMYDTDTYGKNRMMLYVNPGKTFELKNGFSESEANKVYDKYFAPFHEDKFGLYKPHVLDALQSSYKLIDYVKEAAVNLDTTTDEVFKWLGYDSIKDGVQYALFNANQMKSAELVTYDDKEKIIPPSKRFNVENDDIRYSLPDADYMSLAQKESRTKAEDERLERMVDEAAKKAGYGQKVYHGTTNFGWTKPKIQEGKHGERGGYLGVWTAADVESVRYYSGESSDVREIGHGNTEEEIADTKWWQDNFGTEPGRMIADGIYQFYGNTDGFLNVVPEAIPMRYDNIVYKGKKYNTIELAEYAKENGYRGLHIDSILDGNVDSEEFIFFYPGEQLKSADPVTYDDQGNVIPLSERFNEKNEDIRFSLPDNIVEGTEEADEYGRYSLTDNNESRPDAETLKWLNSEPTTTVYRAMQVIDGKLYPPMAAKIKGDNGSQLVQPSEIGEWEQAVEHPELIQNNPAGKPGYFKLDKGNGSSILARYNPYFHTSRIMLNDQFSSASKRPNLVVVEGEVPTSELTSGYKAQYAKDAVGEMSWHAGPVAGKLPKNKTRKVILSRWFKPVRILTDAEVADSIAKLLEGENITIPKNVVTPGLRSELVKRGLMEEGRYSLSDGKSSVDGKVEYLANGKVMSHYYGKEGNVYDSEFLARYSLGNGQLSIFDDDYYSNNVFADVSEDDYLKARKGFVDILKDCVVTERGVTRWYKDPRLAPFVEENFSFLNDWDEKQAKAFINTYKSFHEFEEIKFLRAAINQKNRGRFNALVNERIDELTDQNCKVKVKDRSLDVKISRRQISIDELVELYNYYKFSDELDPLFNSVIQVCRRGHVEFYFTTLLRGAAGDASAMHIRYDLHTFLDDGEMRHTKALVLLHEAIHGATNYLLLKPRLNLSVGELSDSKFDEVHRLTKAKEILSQARSSMMRQETAKRFGDRWYGLLDVNEFLAELANPAFREALSKSKAKPELLKEVANYLVDQLEIAPNSMIETVEKALDVLLNIPFAVFSEDTFARALRETDRLYYPKGFRYSIPDTDSDDNKLSEGQREFFKDSKAVNANGYLAKLYHGTRSLGFTVFDTSLGSFFSDRPDVAQDYSGGTEDIFNPSKTLSFEELVSLFDYFDATFEKFGDEYILNGDNIQKTFKSLEEANTFAWDEYLKKSFDNHGIYSVYLNLKNPLVIEGYGNEWNNIPKWDDVAHAYNYAVLYGGTDGETFNVEFAAAGNESEVQEFTADELKSTFGEKAALMIMNGDEVDDLYLDSNMEELPHTTNEWVREAMAGGYDGVIFRDIYDGGNEPSDVYVAFNPNQIKDTENKNPTEDRDIRYSFQDDLDRKEYKRYTKKEAEEIINDILGDITAKNGMDADGKAWTASIRGKTKEEAIDILAKKLNKTPKGYRIGAALAMADYLIDHVIMTEMIEDNGEIQNAVDFVKAMNAYRHKVRLSRIKDDVHYYNDTKSGGIFLQWAAKEGEGVGADQIARDLQSQGVYLGDIDIDGSDRDIFQGLLDRYAECREEINRKAEQYTIREFGDKETVEKYRQEIARSIVNAFYEKGKKSAVGNAVDRIKAVYETRIDELTDLLKNSEKRNSIVNRVIDLAKKLKDNSIKKYVSSTVLSNPMLDAWAKELGKLVYRSNLRKASAREILLQYAQFYNENNEVLKDWYESQGQDFDANVLGALELLKQNYTSETGKIRPLSYEELQAAEVILGSADALFHNFDASFLEGKRFLTEVLAQEEMDLLAQGDYASSDQKKIFRMLGNFVKGTVEPRVVLEMLDNYDPKGLLTRIFREITNGETKAGAMRVAFLTPFDEFFKKNKKYTKRLTKDTINVNGYDMTVNQAIALYETTKREQAALGLARAGFSYKTDDGKKVHVPGANPRMTVESAMDYAARLGKSIYEQFTGQDKGFIQLVEHFFNTDSKEAKTNADLRFMGYTNVLEEFYFPIHRDETTIASSATNVKSFLKDIAALNNYSFNKNTKKNAATELFIGNVYDMVTTHAKQMSLYANLALPMQTFDRVYNKNLGSKSHVVSVRKFINDNIWDGADNYIKKLMSDIQGVAMLDEGFNVFGWIRGKFASFQLGANPKVVLAQAASLPTAATMLDADVIVKGLLNKVNFADLDKYSDYARVRNYDQTVVKAEGVIDKVSKVGDATTKPIQKMDRLTVGWIWNACQYQVAKRGPALGTEENKIAAAELFENVCRATQPNYTNTERSSMMRSQSEFKKALTMFTSAPLKQYSRLVEAIGAYNYARKTKNKTLIASSGKKLRKTIAAIIAANLVYCMIGQLFVWLFNKKRKDKYGNEIGFVQDYVTDVAVTTVGMVPVLNQITNFFVKGYDVSGFDFDVVNDFLNTSDKITNLVGKAASGQQLQRSDFGSALRSLVYTGGQMTGIPTRNVMNSVMGLFKRFSPEASYQIDTWFYNENYKSDLAKYVDEGNESMSRMLMELYTNEETGSTSKAARDILLDLYTQGYDVLPRAVTNSISYTETDKDGNKKTVSMSLTGKQQDAFKATYGQVNDVIEKMISSKVFKNLDDENKAKALRAVYNAYYAKAKDKITGTDSGNTLNTYFPKDQGKFASAIAGLNEISADLDKNGNAISGTKKTKVFKYLRSSGLSVAETYYVMAIKGYTLTGLGQSEKQAKNALLKYILSLPVSQKEKAAIAEKCGFEVKNNRIVNKKS